MMRKEDSDWQSAGSSQEVTGQLPFVVDKVLSRGVDNLGRRWAYVHWYNWPSDRDSWEPEEAIPDAILARYKRTYGDGQEELECDEKGNLYC